MSWPSAIASSRPVNLTSCVMVITAAVAMTATAATATSAKSFGVFIVLSIHSGGPREPCDLGAYLEPPIVRPGQIAGGFTMPYVGAKLAQFDCPVLPAVALTALGLRRGPAPHAFAVHAREHEIHLRSRHVDGRGATDGLVFFEIRVPRR
jgi:hypothetical protein